MANALQIQGLEEIASTQHFIRMMDQFFDCMNVSNLMNGRKKRKPTLEPYRSADDWRSIIPTNIQITKECAQVHVFHFPKIVQTDSAMKLINAVGACAICVGNPDFVELVSAKGAVPSKVFMIDKVMYIRDNSTAHTLQVDS